MRVALGRRQLAIDNHCETQDHSNKRIGSLDLIRTLAILMVVLCHSIELLYKGIKVSESIVENVCISSLYAISRIGVPLFLMLTGYLLLSKDYSQPDSILYFWKKHFLSLLLIWEAWVIVYYFWYITMYNVAFSLESLLREMLFIDHINFVHGWYVPMILGLYFFLPFVSRALHGIAIQTCNIIIVSIFIIRFVLPTLRYTSVSEISGLYITSPYDGGGVWTIFVTRLLC